MPLQMKLLRNIEPRLYQQTIFATTVRHNTLVVLPTGLGKTVVALLDIAHFLTNHPNKKIVFLAPTKPLCDQHYHSITENIAIPAEKIQLVTGATSPQKRKALYKTSQIIIATPQGFENDVISSRIELDQVSLLIFDEAHRGMGNYSYTFIADQYTKKNTTGRILALTASPGTDAEKIKELCTNLSLERIEVRSEEDSDVKGYVNPLDSTYVEVELDETIRSIQKKLEHLFKAKAKQLQEQNLRINVSQPRKQELLTIQRDLIQKTKTGEKDFEILKGISIVSELIKLLYVSELIETQGIVQAYAHMKAIYDDARKGKTKAAKNLSSEPAFHDIFESLRSLVNEGRIHPKQQKLLDLLSSYYKENERSKKVIVFTQFRDTATELESFLNTNLPVKTHIFLGQAKRNGVGFSQKRQKEIIDEFRNDQFQVLLSTSIGEEGLDIPRVDAVLFYEPIPSAIRTIQRRGRTGRHAIGSMYVLVAKKTRDEAYRWVAHRKEKNMHTVLRSLKKTGLLADDVPKEKSLHSFSGETQAQKETNGAEPNSMVSTQAKPMYPIVVDVREKNSLLTKALVNRNLKISLERLSVADYVISNRLGIEFKTREDFVDSIVDKRIFEQIRELKNRFQFPLIIIQGNENLYAMRQIPPAVIHGVYHMLAVQYKIPVLFTADEEESADILFYLAKKEHAEYHEKGYSDHAKKPKEHDELLLYVISSLPYAGPQLAKNLMLQFKTVQRLSSATIEELQEVPLVGKKTAEELYTFFRTPFSKDV